VNRAKILNAGFVNALYKAERPAESVADSSFFFPDCPYPIKNSKLLLIKPKTSLMSLRRA
jgi:hypothetical protein